MDDNICCGFCKFFFGSDPGFCRRYPPTVFLGKSNMGQPQINSTFPPVDKQKKCGEFQAQISLTSQ